MATQLPTNDLMQSPALQAQRLEPTFTQDDMDDGLDLRQIGLTLWRGRWWVLGIAGLVFSATALFTLNTPMTFQSGGSLYLGDSQQKGSLAGAGVLDMLGASGNAGVADEVEILKSRELIVQTILKTGLNASVTEPNQKAPHLWQWLYSGRDQDLLKPKADALSALQARVTDSHWAGQPLSLKFSAGGAYQVKSPEGKVLGQGRINQPFLQAGLQFTLKPLHTGFQPRAGAEYTLRITPPEQFYGALMQKALSISAPKAGPGKELSIVQVQMQSADPYQASRFSNQLMQDYLAQHLQWKTEEAAATERFVTEQIDKVHASLAQSEQRLASYKKGNNAVMLDEGAKALIERMSDYETQRSAARLQLQALDAISSVLRRPAAPVEAYLLSQVDDPVLTGLSNSLAQTQQELKKLQSGPLADTSERVQEQQALLRKQQASIASYLASKRERLQSDLGNFDHLLGQMEGKLKTVPESELQIVALTRSAEVLGKLYVYLLEKQEEAQITKAATISKSRILDSAIVPEREISPKLSRNLLMGLVLGLGLGAALVLLRRKLAHAYQDENEIRQQFPGLPVFATVPHHALPGKANQARAITGFIPIMESAPQSIQAEAYRLLRTSLYYSGAARTEKIVLLSSSAPQDGKTTTVLNLAYALALDGKRVLVIDGDMRKPSHHMLLGIAQHPGLSAILTGEATWQQTVQPVFEGKLDVITTGIIPPNPAELLSGQALNQFLSEAREIYDFILIDSPPFPYVSDARVFVAQADWLLSVVRVGNSPRKPTEEHVHRLAGTVRHYGLIINDLPVARSGYGYGYGYGYGHGYGQAPALGWKARLPFLQRKRA